MAGSHTHLVVIDLASLRLHRIGDRVDVSTATGEVVTSVRAHDGEPDRLVAFRAFNAVLDQRLPRPVVDADGRVSLVSASVALYNPATGQVAVGSIGKDAQNTVTFGDGCPVALPEEGLVARVDGDGIAFGGRRLPALDLGVRSLNRDLAAHRDPVAA